MTTKPFEELDYQMTPQGSLVLRRRIVNHRDVFEVKLGDEFLMSSQFIAGEVALAEIALAAIGDVGADVLVGGLGLGYTARAALDAPNVRSLVVFEKFAPVIEWHRAGLAPNGAALCADGRAELVEADFFERARRAGEDPGRFHAVLLDIDHSPSALLNQAHRRFYTPEGLREAAAWLPVDGVFAIWSNEPPDEAFMVVLREVFAHAAAHVIDFQSADADRTASNTVYLARKR